MSIKFPNVPYKYRWHIDGRRVSRSLQILAWVTPRYIKRGRNEVRRNEKRVRENGARNGVASVGLAISRESFHPALTRGSSSSRAARHATWYSAGRSKSGARAGIPLERARHQPLPPCHSLSLSPSLFLSMLRLTCVNKFWILSARAMSPKRGKGLRGWPDEPTSADNFRRFGGCRPLILRDRGDSTRHFEWIPKPWAYYTRRNNQLWIITQGF